MYLLSDLGDYLFEWLHLDTQLLIIYSFSCAYNTNFNNKQTNKREISWQYDTHEIPCQNKNQKKKKKKKVPSEPWV